MMVKHYFMIVLAISLNCLVFNTAFAIHKYSGKTIRFPVGCKQMGYKFDLYNVIFTPSTRQYPQTIYFIHNISNKTIYMLQSTDGDNPFIIHINGKIAPNRWSVLAISEPKLKYICTNYNKRKNDLSVINCQKMLDICEFPRARFGTNHRGTYWLLFNRSRRSAVNVARYHGVLLQDRKQDHYP